MAPWVEEFGLAKRITTLKIVLCGPILRRVEPHSVSVFVALKVACQVKLTIYEGNVKTAGNIKLEATAETVPLGKHLHVVVVTAQIPLSAANTNQLLRPGIIYGYDLTFQGAALSSPQDLNSLGLLQGQYALGYEANKLPAFCLPPEDLDHLRIIHGSCRRPHSSGNDAFSALDQIINESRNDALKRPHQLFLTGDQIYADDVATLFLALLIDAGQILLAGTQPNSHKPVWEEPLPQIDSQLKLRPGKRRETVNGEAEFTTKDGENHLLTLGEFCAMYLFVWSDELWPTEYPSFEDVFPGETRTVPHPNHPTFQIENKFFARYKGESQEIKQFQTALPSVRRALANIPSYMIFDDHEVTDDWNLTLDWCQGVYKTALGRRILQNGLLSYAIFQAWGNTPRQFEANQRGRSLLEATTRWIAAETKSVADEHEIAKRVGLPFTNQEVQSFLDRLNTQKVFPFLPDAIEWFYSIQYANHEVIVLDLRTWRSFPGDSLDPPVQLNRQGFDQQIRPTTTNKEIITIVVASTNVMTIPLFALGEKWYIRLLLYLLKYARSGFERSHSLAYDPDLSDSWIGQTKAFEFLLTKLAARSQSSAQRQRILILSGDVHFGWTGRMQYWGDRPFTLDETATITAREAILAHLTSSPIKNQVSIWQRLHRWGYNIFRDKLPEPSQWLGWRMPPEVRQNPNTPAIRPYLEWHPEQLRRSPAMVKVDEIAADVTITPAEPDWCYRIDFLLGEKSDLALTDIVKTPDQMPDPNKALKTFMEVHEVHRNYAHKWGDGLEIIGKNNIAEITFDWSATAAKRVHHTNWWRLTNSTEVLPLTHFTISLEFEDPQYPKPRLRQEG